MFLFRAVGDKNCDVPKWLEMLYFVFAIIC